MALPWSLKDSFACREQLKSVSMLVGYIILKIDIKDFFSSGDATEITVKVAALIDDRELASLVQRALCFLLEHQYVLSKTLPTTYKCKKGSGIGLRHSAVVASLLFYSMVETTLVSSTEGMVKWIRYHDDCLSVMRDRPSSCNMFRKLRELAGDVFIVKCESVHSVGSQLQFLDLDIVVSAPTLSIQAAQNKPITALCPSSAHASFVHMSWPSAVCTRACRLSDDAVEAHSTLCKRYQEANAHPGTLALFRRWAPKLSQSYDSSLLKCSSDSKSPSELASSIFVMRYHPVFRQAFYSALRVVPPPPELQLSVMPAWRNALPSLQNVVETHSKELCRESEKRVGALCVSTHKSLHSYVISNLVQSSPT